MKVAKPVIDIAHELRTFHPSTDERTDDAVCKHVVEVHPRLTTTETQEHAFCKVVVVEIRFMFKVKAIQVELFCKLLNLVLKVRK